MLKRVVVFVYGVASYGVFFATFLYAVGFIGNLVVPKTMDSPSRMPFLYALGIDVLLLGIFAVQHSVMARPWFKRAWTRIVPEPAERSTYVLFSSLALIALFAFWQPLGGMVWDIQNPTARMVMYQLFGLGFGLVLIATFLINHFDLFGLRQVWLYLIGKPYTQLTFRTPLFYKYIRHPLYVGWFMAFWFTPTMTGAHLLFAVMTTVYILMAIRWEESDLIESHGEQYIQYRESVPMFIPNGSTARISGAEANQRLRRKQRRRIAMSQISTTARERIQAQGFCGLSDATYAQINYPLRLAPGIMMVWVAVGTALASAHILWALVPFTALGAILTGHPFDVLYNQGLRYLMGTQELPRYGLRRRFAFAVATIMVSLAAGDSKQACPCSATSSEGQSWPLLA